METQELLKKVRKIEIKSRGLSNQIFSGEYHSAFKGQGMAFSEVREYVPGDPVRIIDWNVTARFNKPFVKVFEEERELTVMLLVDVSASENFGTSVQQKIDLITEICAVLAFSAIQNNDKIGVIFFTDIIEKFIPPKKGKSHILRIIRELIEFKPQNKKTNITQALKFLNNAIKKKCTAFLLSDFIDENYEDSLKIANRKHDIVALKINDKSESNIPDLGLLPIKDLETDELVWVNTSSNEFKKDFVAHHRTHQAKTKNTFQKAGVDFAEINTHQSYVRPLMNLFKQRAR
jgi:uncharacterized protein (DUF58 family)